MNTIRVMVADHSRTMRRAIIEILQADGRFEVVADLPDGRTLREMAVSTQAHLVLLDIHMEAGGRYGAASLAGLTPPPVIVVVSATQDEETVIGMIRAGASGYFVKGSLSDSFVSDLVRCARGEVVLAFPQAGRALRHAL